MIWMLISTLAAAMATQAAQHNVKDTELRRMWAAFRKELQGIEIPAEMSIQFDLMEERGDLPPGWIVHPNRGVMQLFNPVVHVIDDDTSQNDESMEILNRNPSDGWTPVQLFIHANPTTEIEPEDTAQYYAIQMFIELADIQRGSYQQAIDEPWADEPEVANQMFEDAVESIENTYWNTYNQAMDFAPMESLRRAYIGSLRNASVAPEDFMTSDYANIDEIGNPPAWFPGGTDSYPSDNIGFDDILLHLRTQGIRLLNDEFIWADYDVESGNVTGFENTERAAVRALKHGFVIAQIQDGYDIPYYRNYLIYPVPNNGPFVYPWMQNNAWDAEARARMNQLPKKVH